MSETNSTLSDEAIITQITARREQIAQEISKVEAQVTPLKEEYQTNLKDLKTEYETEVSSLEASLTSLRAEDKRLNKTLTYLLPSTPKQTSGKPRQTRQDAPSEAPTAETSYDSAAVIEAAVSVFSDSESGSVRTPALLKAARTVAKGISEEQTITILVDSKKFIRKERGWWGIKTLVQGSSSTATSTPVKPRVALAQAE